MFSDFLATLVCFFCANQQLLAHPCRSEQVDHYHLCINLPPPALLISDSSLAPATASCGDRPMFQTAPAPLVQGTEEGLSFAPLSCCSFTWRGHRVTAAHTNPSSLRRHKALAAWLKHLQTSQQLIVWYHCVHNLRLSHTYSSGFNKVLS